MTTITAQGRCVALMLESDGPGGAENMVLQLAEELHRRGYGVCPVLPAHGVGWLGEEFRKRGFEPQTYLLQGWLDWRGLRGLTAVLRRREVDVVHSHEFTMAFYGSVAARWLRRPHVITMHGGQRVLTHWRRRVAFRWAMRQSRAVVMVSGATRRVFAQGLHVPADAMTVVPNGIVPPVPGNRDAIRRELHLSEDELLIVAIGNLYPVKGHAVLIRALALLGDAGLPRWRLAIAGRGSEAEPLAKLAAEQGLKDRVHLLGFRADVPDILAAADVWAMPSLSEGLPLALLEAMFAGKAIAASAVGGIPEVVTSEEQSLLVPRQDAGALAGAMGRLLRYPDLRAKLGAAARRRAVEEFSISQMTDRYERLYGERA